MPKKLALALVACLVLPAAASQAAQPVNSARGKLTFGTKKRPGPVVSLGVRSRLSGTKRLYAGTIAVIDRRRGVRFKGALVATSVKGVGERKLVGTAVKKLGRRRYTLKFTLTDRGKRRDSLVLRISGPRGRGARRAGRGYRFRGTARKGNISITRVPAFARPVGPIVTPPTTDPGPGPDPPDPPDPSAIDPTVASTVFDSTKFIYEGAGATQTGMAPGTIEANRAAVVRGRVTDRGGAPAGGVAVKLLDRPEFGQTVTDSAGAYALVVNGGESLTLTFTRAGFVPLQRSVEPEWQRWERVEDVVLTARQATPTPASFTADSGSAPIVARGASESDGDGSRRGTLIIPDDTTAQMKMPDGSTEPLTGGNLRITEVTVGDTGPRAMTAPLPAESGYTYAVELSVDQAEAAGASELTFSVPLPYYTENFLGFPVGTTVPLGSYDEQRGRWVASNSGRVIKILSENGSGEAQVDTDGDDTADNTNISAAEQVQLATLYGDGQELWRVELPHFSTWDLNWGVRPPEDAAPPENRPGPGEGAGVTGGRGEGKVQGGGAFGSIDALDQTLTEDVGLTGVDFELSHSTRRSAGYDPSRIVEVRIEDPLPGDVRRIEIDVSVAGRRLTRTLHKPGTAPPGGQEFSPGEVVEVGWDGLDTFGRRLMGAQRARVRVGHTYAAEYGTTSRFGYSQGPAITGSPTRQDLTLWTERAERLGVVGTEAAALGGFSPSIHHTYDPVGEVLYQGDGGVRSGRATGPVIETVAQDAGSRPAYSMNVAPDGSMTWTNPNDTLLVRAEPGGSTELLTQGSAPGNPEGRWLKGSDEQSNDLPVEQVAALSLRDFERAPDGTFLYIDRVCRTRQIYRDGEAVWRVRTIAGRDTDSDRCYNRPDGDGGLAIDAGFGGIFDVFSVSGHPDGGALIADTSDTGGPFVRTKVRRVFPDGRIATIGNADVPRRFSVSHQVNSLSVDREGRVIWRSECYVGRIELDGTSTLIAGVDEAVDSPLPFEEGVDAKRVLLCGADGNAGASLWGSAEAGPDGAVYFNFRGAVMRVGADGRLTTFAGQPTNPEVQDQNKGDGGTARLAIIAQVAGLGFDGEGRLVIATGLDGNGSIPTRIRRVDAPLPGFQRNDEAHRIPSEDGQEVYVFGATGRHLRTRDALTGATLWEFAYDAAGRLTSIDDVDDDRTTIERNAAGVATAIVGPDGDRTVLSHDGSKRLTSVRNPANETTAFEWAGGDLLSAAVGARGNRFEFTYDGDGRIERADDPDDPNGPEGFHTFTRTRNATTTTVTDESALGRETVHRVIRPPSGARRRTLTNPAGDVATEETATDDQTVITAPDGTVITSTLGPDPRYGMLAPVRTRTEVNPPGSTPTATTLGERTIAGLDALDPFDFTSITETVSETNGTAGAGDDRTTTSTYTSGPRTLELRSAEAPSRKITSTLDAEGRVTRIAPAGEDPVDLTYRPDGRLTAQTRGNRTTTYGYDGSGRPTQITDATGAATGFGYDAARRLRTIAQPAPIDADVVLARDANGNVSGVTTPLAAQHTFAFRPSEALRLATPPNVGGGPASGATTLSHDADRALTGADVPGSSDFTLGYASNGRLQTVTADGAGVTTPSYDGSGRLSGLDAPDADLTFGYDGDLPTTETWSAGVTGSVARTYDADHRVATQSVAGDGAASTVTYGYDADSLLTEITGAMAATIERDADTGRVEAIETGGGPTREEAVYSDAFGELSDQTVTHGPTELLSTQYARDGLGRITSRTEAVDGGAEETTTYDYDDAGRLTSATTAGEGTTNYTWDDNGNRTSGGATYDAQDRLTQTAAATYTHTPEGRRRTRTEGSDTTTYSYDANGALRDVDIPGADDVAYGIDGLGRRVERRVGASVTNRWLYDPGGRIVAELDGDNDLVASYAYAHGGHVPFLMRRGGTTYRLVTDTVGSVRLVVDASDGSIAQRIDYDPFGVPDFDDSPGLEDPGFIPFGFAGGHYDPATGLVRMGARDYDPATGRFTAKDPLGFDGGYTSLYSYVGGDPVNGTDPTGLGPKTGNAGAGGGGPTPRPRDRFGMSAGPAPVRPEVMAAGAAGGPRSGGPGGSGGGGPLYGGAGPGGWPRPGPAPVRDRSAGLGGAIGGSQSGGPGGSGGGPLTGGMGPGGWPRPGPAPVRDPSAAVGGAIGGPQSGGPGGSGGGGAQYGGIGPGGVPRPGPAPVAIPPGVGPMVMGGSGIAGSGFGFGLMGGSGGGAGIGGAR